MRLRARIVRPAPRGPSGAAAPGSDGAASSSSRLLPPRVGAPRSPPHTGRALEFETPRIGVEGPAGRPDCGDRRRPGGESQTGRSSGARRPARDLAVPWLVLSLLERLQPPDAVPLRQARGVRVARALSGAGG